MTRALKCHLRFLWAFMQNGRRTGAVAPSQRFLIGRMIAPVPESYTGQLIELGAGNGALTIRLARRCPRATVLAWEVNPALAEDLRENVARAGVGSRVEVIADAAENLPLEMARREMDKADYVISGIPLGALPRENTEFLIDTIAGTLREDGLYIQFQYSLVDRKKIAARFSSLRTVPVLLNFPPAVVYYAWR